jgi:hypothetical protein
MEYNMDWLVNDYGKFLEKFGLNEQSVRNHYGEWRVQSGVDSARDYLWYLFQVILGETAKQVKLPLDLYKNNLEIYTAMWFFRTHVEGQKSNELQQLINDTKIRIWQSELPFRFTVKLAGENCCTYCDNLNGQLFSPTEMLEHRAFAVNNCTNDGGCSCVISPIAERDASNQIILKDPVAN